MGNIREEYKVKKDTLNKYDIAAYPFGAEEMLLESELKKLDLDKDER